MKKPNPKQTMEAVLGSLDQKPSDTQPDTAPQKGPGYFSDRQKNVEQIMNGERIRRTIFKVDTRVCRLWSRHNRLFESLTEEDCDDLITGFKTNGQEIPVIARDVSDEDGPYQYEIIAGARRFWTARYLNMPILVEPRKLTDLEAFKISDIENRERKDISEYERARDYLRALEEYQYFDNQKQMAVSIGITDAGLSYLLNIARLPDVVLDAFGDRRRVTGKMARDLRKFLKTDEATVLKAAQAILDSVKEQGNQPAPEVVMKSLNPANSKKGESTEIKKAVTVFNNQRGRPVIKRVRTGNEIKVSVRIGKDGVQEEQFNQLLTEFASRAGLKLKD